MIYILKEISFDLYAESLKQDYLDIFEGVQSHVVYTALYDKNNAIETTYLGKPKLRRQDKLTADLKYP